MNTTTIILIVAAILVIWFIAIYNSFIRFITRAKEAWADIDVQLKRRYDLIPNLIETVKGYATHEKEAFEKVTQARSAAMGAKSMGDHSKSEALLGVALTGLFGIAEAYPDLKANQNFLSLQAELSDTENKIQASRRFYNTNVRDLNIKIDSFPSNLVSKMFKFGSMEFFELDEGEAAAKNPVKVKF